MFSVVAAAIRSRTASGGNVVLIGRMGPWAGLATKVLHGFFDDLEIVGDGLHADGRALVGFRGRRWAAVGAGDERLQLRPLAGPMTSALASFSAVVGLMSL